MSNKFICAKCDFTSDYKSAWERHITTELHKTGKRKKRSDLKAPLKCAQCDYKTKNTISYKKHILNDHADKKTREKEFKYYCKYCDFGTFSQDTLSVHNNTKKHKSFMDIINKQTNLLPYTISQSTTR